jgi:DNA-binding response OmpR family regulator
MDRLAPVALLDGRLDPGPLGDDQRHRLTPQERAVYDVLATNCGRVVSRVEIARSAGLFDCSERRCDALIVGIRRTIGEHRIRTVRRRGWMLLG